ncbi:MAG: hypothetical protein JW836_10805 [Deltaproteobacteria bacterium]|nr:hypothetical protein [Deltaproteobacteria bacterium]
MALSAEKDNRIAVPLFKGRVAPVLDTCSQLLVMDPEMRCLTVECASLNDRVKLLQNLGIRVIVCGAVSEYLYNLLEEKKIRLISGISGDVEEVLQAYRDGRLHHPCFRMPGFSK